MYSLMTHCTCQCCIKLLVRNVCTLQSTVQFQSHAEQLSVVCSSLCDNEVQVGRIMQCNTLQSSLVPVEYRGILYLWCHHYYAMYTRKVQCNVSRTVKHNAVQCIAQWSREVHALKCKAQYHSKVKCIIVQCILRQQSTMHQSLMHTRAAKHNALYCNAKQDSAKKDRTSTMRYSAMHSKTVKHNAVQCNAVRTVGHNAVQ